MATCFILLHMTVGIDEVGRGSWAGPLTVAAVAWPDGLPRRGLADSKVLKPEQRVKMALRIKQLAHSVGIGWASPTEIDKLGLSEALKLAARRALGQLDQSVINQIIIDGNIKLINDARAVTIIKADAKVPAVMAASIVAKVARDAYMCRVSPLYAHYQFARHVGYGTTQHKTALAQFGPCDLHRFSYQPLKEFIA